MSHVACYYTYLNDDEKCIQSQDTLTVSSIPNYENIDSIKFIKMHVTYDVNLPNLQDLCIFNSTVNFTVQLPDTLEFLNLKKSVISGLEKMPPNISRLYLDTTEMNKYIDKIPDSVKYLNLGKCNLKNLKTSQNLKELILRNCNLNSKINFPASLTYLHLEKCRISVPLELPDSLEYLAIMNSNLLDISDLPKSLKILNVHSNNLTTLPELPDLIELNICHNKFTTLPKLPKTLNFLHCEHNDIQEIIEPFPDSLEDIHFYSNINLKTLPVFGENVKFVGLSKCDLIKEVKVTSFSTEVYNRNNKVKKILDQFDFNIKPTVVQNIDL